MQNSFKMNGESEMKEYNRFQIKNCIFTILIVGILALVVVSPVHAKNSAFSSLSLSGQRAVIMDMDSGKILYKKNPNVHCHNASTTKLATAIVAVEQNKSLKKKVRISGNASGVGSSSDTVKLGMSTGDSYYLEDLLHGMLLKSANDTSVAIAEGTSGSEARFMKQVNKKMKKIGCKNTVFGSSNGLRSSNTHYTTAKDLALIMRYAYKNDTIRGIMKKKSYSFKSIGGRYHTVSNTNALLSSKDYYCIGKTGNGWTAKYCYTGVYTYKAHSYVLVTLGNATDGGKWSDAKKMIAACKKDAKAVQKNLALNKTEAEIKVGSTVGLKVRKIKADVKWTSKNKQIATVDENGKVTGKKVGTTTIYAKVYGKTLKCKVKVVENTTTETSEVVTD